MNMITGLFSNIRDAVNIPIAQVISTTVAAVVTDKVTALLHKEISRFQNFPMDKEQLIQELSCLRCFLEGVASDPILSEKTKIWLCEIEKRVSDAELVLEEIGEDNPNWLNYRRRGHAIVVEEHRKKLDEITNFGSKIFIESGSERGFLVWQFGVTGKVVEVVKKNPWSVVEEEFEAGAAVKNPWSVVEEVKMVFKAIDVNGDGKISVSELKEMYRGLGSEKTVEELKMMMVEIDKDGDGFIDLNEFTDFYLRGSDETKELKMLVKKLGKKKRSVDEPSSMVDSSESGTNGRKLKKMRTQLKA